MTKKKEKVKTQSPIEVIECEGYRVKDIKHLLEQVPEHYVMLAAGDDDWSLVIDHDSGMVSLINRNDVVLFKK